MDLRHWKKGFTARFVLGAVLLGGVIILFNMVLHHFHLGRFDLTADQVYKLSPSVKKILSQLEAPIEITYYVSSSEKMPTQWKNLERDVIDKLKELKLVSNGKLNYTVFDPSAEEEKEAIEAEKNKDRATVRKKIAERLFEKGVIPFGVQSTERDEFAIKRVYSSIVLSYLDRKEEVIEEVRPETFGSLEYEIISRIFRLISNKRPRIGFYPGVPEIPPQMRQYYRQSPPDMYEETVKILKEAGYEVLRTNITKEEPIPERIETMLVMVDEPLNQRQLYELDKCVHRGTRLILGAQMHNYQIQYVGPGTFDLRAIPTGVNINELVRHYGFEFDNKLFMDKNTAYIQVPVYSTRNLGFLQLREQRLEPVTKPVMIRVDPEYINQKLSISNKISELFYLYGTRILLQEDILKKDTLFNHVLFTSSDMSWTREGRGYGPVNTDPPSEDAVIKKQPLAIMVEGSFRPKFSEGNIPSWPGSDEEVKDTSGVDIPTELTGKGKRTQIIAIGCANLFKTDMLKSIPSHRALLRNVVDALTLGEDLIHIRSKTITTRRIKTVGPTGKAIAKAFVVWFPPVVFVALGFYLNLKRKKKVVSDIFKNRG